MSSAEIQGSPENATLVAEAAAMRQTAQRAIHARFKSASRDGELPPNTDTAALAAFYAMVVQGMSTQARDGASTAMLRRDADLAMRAWPSAQGRREDRKFNPWRRGVAPWPSASAILQTSALLVPS